MYACAGGHEEVVKALLEAGANVEDHNENGHTPLMEAASAGHVGVAKVSSQLSQRGPVNEETRGQWPCRTSMRGRRWTKWS